MFPFTYLGMGTREASKLAGDGDGKSKYLVGTGNKSGGEEIFSKSFLGFFHEVFYHYIYSAVVVIHNDAVLSGDCIVHAPSCCLYTVD